MQVVDNGAAAPAVSMDANASDDAVEALCAETKRLTVSKTEAGAINIMWAGVTWDGLTQREVSAHMLVLRAMLADEYWQRDLRITGPQRLSDSLTSAVFVDSSAHYEEAQCVDVFSSALVTSLRLKPLPVKPHGADTSAFVAFTLLPIKAFAVCVLTDTERQALTREECVNIAFQCQMALSTEA